MTTALGRSAALAAAVLALAAAPAGDTYTATAALDGQRAPFAHGLAFWNAAKGEASVGFFGAAPDAAFEAKAKKVGLCCGNTEGAYVVLDLQFEKGAPRASAKAFSSCHIAFLGFKASPFDWNAAASGCGLVEITGDLKPGGVLRGTLKGSGKSQAFGPFAAKAYEWDFRFAATLKPVP